MRSFGVTLVDFSSVPQALPGILEGLLLLLGDILLYLFNAAF